MSLRKSSQRKFLVLGLLSMILGVGGTLSWMSQDEDSPWNHDAAAMNKSNVPLETVISVPNGLPTNADETTKLEAVITQLEDMGGEPITYHWNLPKGVSIQTGELSGVILGLNNSSATISISVKGLSSGEQKSVFLDLNTDMNGQSIGMTASYSTFETNADLSVSPRQPASKGWFQKASGSSGKKGLPPKGIHF